jgi:RNA polymerase sigma factor (sigma-70 family)
VSLCATFPQFGGTEASEGVWAPVAERDLAVLVRDAGAGDATAWEQLVDRLAPLLWSIVRAYRLGDADAQDVLQTGWLRLLERLDQLSDPARVGSWLATTVRRESLRVLRQRGRAVPTDVHALDLGADDELTPEAVVLRGERAGMLARAFARLTARCQALLRVLAAADSYEEVAAAFDMPIGAIGPTRARCLESLRRQLAVGGMGGIDARRAER